MTTPRRNRVDLHTHTSRSDGVLAPVELYAQMRAYGMRLVAITDHDTLDGFRELRALGLGSEPSEAGPQIIPALEINTLADLPGLWEDELHILGFGIDPEDQQLEETLADQRKLRLRRLFAVVERLAELGTPISRWLPETLPADFSSAGRPHIARALVKAGHAATVGEAFAKYIGEGAPAYLPRVGIGPEQAVRAIKAAGGLAVVAHFPEALERPELIERMMSWGLDGIEVYYSGFHRDPLSAETISRLAAFAKERQLLVTGGSDYHGDSMDYAAAQARTSVPDEVGERLLEAIAGRNSRVD